MLTPRFVAMDEEQSKQLIDRLRAGDPQAEELLVGQYVQRLVGLVRKQQSPKVQPRFDPEDVVQSALRSFCQRIRDGQYTLSGSNATWNLLAKITINKYHGRVQHHTAEARDVGREQEFTSSDGLMQAPFEALSQEPTPSEVLILDELLQQLLENYQPIEREMIELRLQGYHLKEIADKVRRSEHQVGRVLKKVKATLTKWAEDSVRA